MRADWNAPWGDIRGVRQHGAMTRSQSRPPLYALEPSVVAIDANGLPVESNTAPENTTPVVDNTRFGEFAHLPFSVGTDPAAPVLLRAQTKRTYLLIENTSVGDKLYVGFGQQPSASVGVTIQPGGNFLADVTVPQNDLYLTGSAAGVTGKITYCNAGYGQIG